MLYGAYGTTGRLILDEARSRGHRPVVAGRDAPLAEVIAVHRSTGVPHIVGGVPMSYATAALVRAAGPWIGKVLARLAARPSYSTAPPATAALATMRSRIWAEATNEAGQTIVARLETGEGYRAAAAAVRAVESLLDAPRIGALTPVQAFGADFAVAVPGTRIQDPAMTTCRERRAAEDWSVICFAIPTLCGPRDGSAPTPSRLSPRRCGP
jgi:short subunit dehydrogenase-like uncharacterized protein